MIQWFKEHLDILFLMGVTCLIAAYTMSCSTTPQVYPRHALVDQILKPRVGFKGLTNRACEPNDKGSCDWKIIEYLFEDPDFRRTVTALGFICSVGGKRYKICKDEPGLCRITYKGFLFKERKTDYIPASDYQFMLDAKTKCFAKNNYPFDTP